ncbi:hypothetical protein M885DRAFT_525592 [Pelagophyceae sp. CCMP2097]|nr:hypothetical protein M885DRAFT_525592 [Pelagophyceae sp. CCMP2097]
MLFLGECPLKDNALLWAQESSRMKRELAAVVALYDAEEVPIYVGAFDDAIFAVAALVRKHGYVQVSAMRYEEFPADALEDPMAARMMQSLAAAWLAEATADFGAPRGNADADWVTFDKDSNPFIAGVIGVDATVGAMAAFRNPEDEAAERLQKRRENMKRRMDEAIVSGDERLAMALMRRLSDLDDGIEDEEEAPYL